MKVILFSLFAAIVMGCSFGNKPSQEAATVADSIVVDNPVDSSHLEVADDKNRLPDFDNSTHSLNDDARSIILSKSLYNLTDWMIVPDTSTAMKMTLISALIPWGRMEEGQDPLESKPVNVGEFDEVVGAGTIWWAFTLAFDYDHNADNYTALVFKSVTGYQHATNLDEQPFKHLNPDVAKWAFANLYLPPNRELQGVKLQTLYNNSFRKIARTLASSHEVLGGSLQEQADWYKEAIIDGGQDVREYYAQRYPAPGRFGNKINPYYFPRACTFWIRRTMDGTEGLLWSYTKRMIKDYDREWGCENLQLCD